MRDMRPKLAVVKPPARPGRRIPAEHRDQRMSAIDATRSARAKVVLLSNYNGALTTREKEDVTAALCALNDLMEKLVPMPMERGKR